jgi:hypothetical protein
MSCHHKTKCETELSNSPPCSYFWFFTKVAPSKVGHALKFYHHTKFHGPTLIAASFASTSDVWCGCKTPICLEKKNQADQTRNLTQNPLKEYHTSVLFCKHHIPSFSVKNSNCWFISISTWLLKITKLNKYTFRIFQKAFCRQKSSCWNSLLTIVFSLFTHKKPVYCFHTVVHNYYYLIPHSERHITFHMCVTSPKLIFRHVPTSQIVRSCWDMFQKHHVASAEIAVFTSDKCLHQRD